MRGPLLGVCLLGLVGCGATVDFRPASAKQRVGGQLVDRAVRLESLGAVGTCGASDIGTLRMTGDYQDVTIAHFAEAVADAGGTHYAITDERFSGEDRWEETRHYETDDDGPRVRARGRGYRQRENVIVATVYRLERSGWDCASFSPPRSD